MCGEENADLSLCQGGIKEESGEDNETEDIDDNRNILDGNKMPELAELSLMEQLEFTICAEKLANSGEIEVN